VDLNFCETPVIQSLRRPWSSQTVGSRQQEASPRNEVALDARLRNLWVGQLRVNVAVVQKEGACEYIIVCPLLSLLHHTDSRHNQPEKTISITMLSNTLLTLTALAGSAAAHYKLLAPEWRGDSFEGTASQWIFPCTSFSPYLFPLRASSTQDLPPSSHMLTHPLTPLRRQRQ
jgi:hypothetical protein